MQDIRAAGCRSEVLPKGPRMLRTSVNEQRLHVGLGRHDSVFTLMCNAGVTDDVSVAGCRS